MPGYRGVELPQRDLRNGFNPEAAARPRGNQIDAAVTADKRKNIIPGKMIKETIMRKAELGKTGLFVSKLSFGADTGFDADRGGRLLKRAFELGVNLWDTSDDYGTHPAVREGLRGLEREQVVIATKTHARTRQAARQSLDLALEELETDYVDIYHLHAVDTVEDLNSRMGAVEMLVDAKREGKIKAIGLSTHSVEGMQAAGVMDEIDVILVVINKTGVRIAGSGTREQMLAAIKTAYENGKGIYAMKTLGRDKLLDDVQGALTYVLTLPHVHSAAVGMKSIEELEMNVRVANGLLGTP